MKKRKIERREFLRAAAIGGTSILFGRSLTGCADDKRIGKRYDYHKPRPCRRGRGKPNLVYVFADQWRAQATGYAGDVNAKTPNLDKLVGESINFTNAVSGCSVCSPHRASLMTGQFPLTHGVFINDVRLSTKAVSIAQAFNQAGYETGYIGKWHLDGEYRSAFTPKHRRQGFKFWRALDCTHYYNDSYYYADKDVKLKWKGYDAIAQTKEAQHYIRRHADGKPFALFLSWGPPHNPYHTAPEKYKALFDEDKIVLRPNVPKDLEHKARKSLAGYYAHIAALDDCIGRIKQTLKDCGLEKNTIFVFSSDHGDMLYSQSQVRKQRPWNESIMVPFLLRYPVMHGKKGKTINMPINTPDIMPTLLGLCDINIPDTVEGTDFSGIVRAAEQPKDNAVLITCPAAFSNWKVHGGVEYRGVRTKRYTYVRTLKGPWLLYDNHQDPYQLNNLCNKPGYSELQKELELILSQKLRQTNDEFLPAEEYIKKWNYVVDENGAAPYTL